MQLAHIDLADNFLSGTLPSSWANLTQVSYAQASVQSGTCHDQQLLRKLLAEGIV